VFYAYLFTTIVGAVLLGVSLIGGHDGDGDGDHGDHGGAASFFSLRVWTYLFTFGGGTGLLLHLLGAASPLVTALVALGVGVTAGLGARAVIRRMMTDGEGGTVQAHELAGRTAQVLLPAAAGAKGQIRLTIRNSIVDLLAVSDEGELEAKGEVIIVDVKDGVATVTRNPAAMRTLGPAKGDRE
jgi:membrane protein implicated in regulation of membrane protease activity